MISLPDQPFQQAVSTITRGIIEPLCEATTNILRPVDLWDSDRMSIDVTKDGRYFVCKIYREGGRRPDGRLEKLASSGRARSWTDRVPESKKLDSYGADWHFAATYITCIIINVIWPESKLVFTSEARMIYDGLLLGFLHQSVVSRQKADYKLTNTVPPAPDDFVDHPDKPLAPYQLAACFSHLNMDGSALFMQQGTGKTPTEIRSMNHDALIKRRGNAKSQYLHLVVCPKNVRENWQREIHKFATVDGKVTVLRGTQLVRIKQLIEAVQDDSEALFSTVICSYDAVRNSWDALSLVEWDRITVDESHALKNPYAKRQKLFFKLRERGKKRIVMTGTPVTNSILDLYGQLEFLGEGYSGFQSWKAFRTFYGKFEKNEYTKKEKFIGYQNLPFLQERLARLAFMITKKEALPFLPEKTYDTIEVAMTSVQREAYVNLQSSLALQVNEKLEAAEASGENNTVTINCILTMLLRLAQITSGHLVLDSKLDPETMEVLQGKAIKYFTPSPKLEALVEVLEGEPDETKTLVWTNFVPDIKAISARLTAEGIKHVVFYGQTTDKARAQAEYDFNNDPDTRVFVGNPAAGGVGLNLWGYNPDKPEQTHRNADHVIYYAQNWSMVARAQSEDRNHRRGTRVPVRYTTMVVPETIDETIHARVAEKILNAENIQDVRAIMKRVLEMIPTETENLTNSEENDNDDAAE